jgi:hypothetical protein
MRRLLESSILAVVLLLESSALSAPPAPEPPEPAAQREMREQANRLVKEGRLADARDIHLSLWRINGRATPAFNVGMLSYRVRDFAMAAEFLTLWFDLVGSADDPKVPVVSAEDHKKSYERARVDLQEALKQVEALRVNVSDPGADVLVHAITVNSTLLSASSARTAAGHATDASWIFPASLTRTASRTFAAPRRRASAPPATMEERTATKRTWTAAPMRAGPAKTGRGAHRN